MTILLSALAILASSVSGQPRVGTEIFVKTAKTVSVERLAEAVAPMGLLETRMRGTTTYLISLKPGVDSEKAKQRLEKIPGVKALEPDQEPVDMSSIRSLDRKIAHLSADEKEDRAAGKLKQSAHERDRVDYLKAYRYFTAQRAFPNDKVDWSSFERGREHAAGMRPTQRAFVGSGPHPETTPQWVFLGPTNLQVPYEQYYGTGVINGRVNSVAFDPSNAQVMYAGAAQGGLWKSSDGGSTWAWLSSTWTQLGVNRVVIDPTNSKTIYVARGDYHGEIAGSYGIMKSTDGGTSWTEIASASMGKVGVDSLLIDPTNAQTLIAGTGDVNFYGAMYRSTNGGQTWTKISSLGGNDNMWPALAASFPSSGTARLYAVAAGIAKSSGASSRVFKSDDHGATWQAVASPMVPDGNFHWAYAVAASPTNSKNVYVLDSENQEFYSSTNQGGAWTDLGADLPTGNDIGSNYNFSQSYYDFHLECGSRTTNGVTSDVVYLGEIDITESLDGGNTWISIGGPTYESNAIAHNDQHSLAVCPTNPNLALFSNDGGVYTVSFSPASGQNTVSSLNQNLGNSMFYKIALHPTIANYLLGGTQDNASPLSTGDLTNWLNVGGGDGGGSAINQTNPLIQYTTSEDLSVYRTGDGWSSEQDISPNTTGNDNLPFVATMTLDSSNQGLMYVGTNYIYQWSEATQNWAGPLGGQDVTNLNQGAIVQAIAVAPTDTNRIYTGSSDGALYMTANQGSTWTQLNPGSTALPNAAITSISVSPTNENDILIGYSGTGQGFTHLWRCSNTQATSIAFTKVGGSGANAQPDVSLNAIARDILNPTTTWWVAMDVGVFESSDSGSTWTNAGSSMGLPNVIVDDLVVNKTTGYIVAGTYGRGMWRLPLPTSTGTLTKFTISPTTVNAGGTSTGTVTISEAAPIGGAPVSVSSSNTLVATVPTSVLIPAGATSTTFAISADASVIGQGTSVITAVYSNTSLNQTLTVNGITLSSLTLSPTSVVGGSSSTGTVTLSATAPTGGVSINLSSGSSSATVPASVTVPAGSTSATFTVSTTAVATSTSAVITGKLGTASQAATLTITPPSLSSVSVSPASVAGGSSSTGTVTLSGPAPTGGTAVSLTSSITVAKVPTSVTVSAGSTTGTFTITTSSVSTSTSATISATLATVTKTTTLTITPAGLQSVTVTPTSLIGGKTSSGLVTLSGPAGASGIVVSLTSSSANATLPASVTVASGATTASFTVSTTPVGASTPVTITAKTGTVQQTATLTINPATPTSFTISPTTVLGGSSSTGTVTLNGAAPTGGTAVALSSNTTSASVPASVTVAAGATTATFTITTSTVAANTSATITASQGGTSLTATLTIQSPLLASVSVSPTSVPGGTSATGTIALSRAAPSGGAAVSLSASGTGVTVPASVTVASGATSATFTVTTSPVATTVAATVTASLSGTKKTATLTVLPPALSSLVIAPASVVGGNSATGTVTISGPAPTGGLSIGLASNITSAAVPTTVSIPAGALTATFTVTTKSVSSVTTATIKATLGTGSLSTPLTINPVSLQSVSTAPNPVVGGSNTAVVGTVTLNGPALSPGTVVTLKSSNTAIVTVPTSVTIATGSSSATFAVTHKLVSTSTNVTITATVGSVSQTSTLTVNPFAISTLSFSPTSVTGGTSVTGTATLNAQPGTSGAVVVKLTSTSKSITFPASVTVAVGASTATFTVKTVAVASVTSATLTGTVGTSTAQATVSIQPAALLSLSVSPTSVKGSSTTVVTGTVTLNGPAPSTGLTISLSSSNTAAATVPTTVKVVSGQTKVTFTVTHKKVTTSATVTLTASAGTVSKTATLTVTP